MALTVIVTLSSCSFSVKHPAATAGIVGATLGFTTCELGTGLDAHGACAIVGGSAALLLGGVVFLAILLGGEGNTVLNAPDEDTRPEPPSIDDVPPPDAPPAEPVPDAAPVLDAPVPST